MRRPCSPGPIRVRGMMLEYNGKPQFRVDRMRPVAPGDDFDIALLVPAAPEPSQDMLDFVLNRVDAIADRKLYRRLEPDGGEGEGEM